MPDNVKMKNLGRIALFSASLLWGVSFVTMKNVLSNIPPLYIISIRFCGAALILLPACVRRLKVIDRSYIIGSAMMGIALLLAYAFQTYGLSLTTPGKNAFLTSAYCVMTPFLYWFFTKKKPDKYNVSSAFICIIGIGFITIDGDMKIGAGDALTVVCGLFYALHIVAAARYVENRDPVTLVMLQFAMTGVAALICGIVFERPPAVPAAADIWSLVFLTVVCTAGCILLQVFGQKYTPPSQAAVIMTLESVFGALFSFIFYNEAMTGRLLAGFALTFAAVIISETKPGALRGTRSADKDY